MGFWKTTSGGLTKERHHVTVDTGNRVGGSHLLLAINPPFRSDQEQQISVEFFTNDEFSYLKDSASGPQSSVLVFRFKMARRKNVNHRRSRSTATERTDHNSRVLRNGNLVNHLSVPAFDGVGQGNGSRVTRITSGRRHRSVETKNFVYNRVQVFQRV
jgi:hypothetical protein